MDTARRSAARQPIGPQADPSPRATSAGALPRLPPSLKNSPAGRSPSPGIWPRKPRRLTQLEANLSAGQVEAPQHFGALREARFLAQGHRVLP